MRFGKMRVFSLCVILGIILILSTQCFAKVDPKSIVGIWLFDDGKGNVARDSSGNGNDGEIKGDLKWVNGKFGQALEFPGVNDNFVEVPHNDSLTLKTFSFMAWVKIQPTGGYQSILIKTENGSIENYSGYLMDSTNVFWTRFTSGGAGQWGFQKWGAKSAADDEWHHLAGTYDMKTVTSYIDGEVEAEPAFSKEPDASPGPLNIGDCPNYPYCVKGIMDDIGLFNVGLSAAEIKSIMNDGLAKSSAVASSGKLTTVWGSIKK